MAAMKPVSKLKRVLLIAVILTALFTVVGFFVLPPIIRSQLEQRLSTELGRRVTLGKAKLNPYALSVTLENFAILERDTPEVFLGWRLLHVNFEALASIRGEWVLREVSLDGLDGRVAREADGSLSIADILAKLNPPTDSPPPPSTKEPRPLRVDSLRISDARFAFADHSQTHPFATTLGPVTFALTDFHTSSARGAPYHFDATTESGERLAWTGTLQATPLRSSGKLSIENLALVKYAPYYANQLHGDLTAGTLSVQGRYELSLVKGGEPTLEFLEGGIRLRGVTLLERGSQQPALDLASFDVTGIHANMTTRQITVGAVDLTGAHVRARREADGSINLLALLAPADATPSAAPGPITPVTATPASPPLTLAITAVTVKETRIDILDNAAPRPVRLGLENIQASLRDVSLLAGAPMPLELAVNWAPRGTLRLTGKIALNPWQAKLDTVIEGIDLLPLSPYLEQFAAARLTGGSFTAQLNVDANGENAAVPAGVVTGNLRLDNFALVDAAHNEPLAGFGAVTLTGLRATAGAQTGLTLDELAVTAPYARVVVNPDKTLNLGVALGGPETSTRTTVETPPPAAVANATASRSPSPTLAIARVVIVDGDYRFTDRSITPAVNLSLNRFGGTLSGLSSTEAGKADVDLKAMVDGAGLVSITGRIDPLKERKSIDLKVDFKNVDLLPLSPYSGKYAGYELIRGKLLLDLKVALEGNDIDASNVVTLNQFTFGNQVSSPDATSLPVRLGVALLKDRDGNIVIDLPIKGSTEDPEFRIGRVVSRVIVNLLSKVATSPFALLGAAFGGNAEELSHQDFAAGSTELLSSETKKIEALILALTNRPALNVALEGMFDREADSHVLKRTKLAAQVRRNIWQESRASDPNLPPPETLEITPEVYTAMVKQMFAQKFPPGTEFGTPIPPPPVPAAAPASPPPPLYRRAFQAITLQNRREQRQVEAEKARIAAEHATAVQTAIAQGQPLDEMAERLAEAIEVDENDLRSLAQARSQKVRDAIIAGGIEPERLFMATDRTVTATPREGSRVFLTLQ